MATTSVDVLAVIKDRIPGVEKTKAMKLVYYAQAWTLTWTGRRLFDEPIEAWQYGPIARKAFGAYDATEPDANRVDNEQLRIIEAVLNEYGKLSVSEIVDRSHTDSPWALTYNSPGGGHANGKVIRDSMIRNAYTKDALEGRGIAKPHTTGTAIPSDLLERVRARAVNRWGGVLELLADR